ncbi:MAG: ribosome silencing factor [Firmicutes bacterium]|nr:ribosome silencing factor [Bacillota bacterium]
MTTVGLKNAIIKILKEKNGGDVKGVNLSGQSSVADFFVVVTGKNPSHVKALAEAVEEKLEKKKIFAERKDGLSDARWAVLDYGNVIVHIFNADTRDFFCLEKLWKKGKKAESAPQEEQA